MVTHTWNLCSAFNPSKCTHTHTVTTHPEQWAANVAAPGEQLGVRCLAQGSNLSHGIEGGESAGYSLPPPTIPAGPETRTHDLRVTSPTLYPLGHDCPLIVINIQFYVFIFLFLLKQIKRLFKNDHQFEIWLDYFAHLKTILYLLRLPLFYFRFCFHFWKT